MTTTTDFPFPGSDSGPAHVAAPQDVEAALLAGVSVSGMKSRVQRGRARLRELLLTCCSVSQDVRGRVQDFEPRASGCSC